MNVLSPLEAARIADGVYRLRNDSIEEVHRRGGRLGCEDLFKTDGGQRFVGASGAIFKSISGFGYLAAGVGRRQGEVLCVTRGTVGRADWATNFNVGLQVGPGGQLVHAGFNDTWKSCSPAVQDFFRNRNPSHIHCVGHSLGGALATLNADFFSSGSMARVTLYTFGAPRVGISGFVRGLTTRIGASSIYRLSHVADPVPLIPIYPFLHIPSTGSAHVLGAGRNTSISVDAHNMLNSYIPGVATSNWDDLRAHSVPVTQEEIDRWLTETSGGSRVLMYSTRALQMIGRCLTWMLEKSAAVLTGAVGVGLTLTMTVLDRLAWMLAQGASLSVELSTYANAMLRAIMRFLGRAAQTTYELTTQFVRWVLDLLFQALSAMGRQALAVVGA